MGGGGGYFSIPNRGGGGSWCVAFPQSFLLLPGAPQSSREAPRALPRPCCWPEGEARQATPGPACCCSWPRGCWPVPGALRARRRPGAESWTALPLRAAVRSTRRKQAGFASGQRPRVVIGSVFKKVLLPSPLCRVFFLLKHLPPFPQSIPSVSVSRIKIGQLLFH